MVALRAWAKRALPLPVLRWVQRLRRAADSFRFRRQGTTVVTVGGYELQLPDRHSLISLIREQPFRDRNVGLVAGFIAEKNPAATLVDIGANIGDTAAIMRANAGNPLVLVEASDYFFDYLQRNAPLFGGDVRLEHVYVGDGEPVVGELVHWGGTAYIDGEASQASRATVTINELLRGRGAGFVKIDTDGFDRNIILGNLDFFQTSRPCILFENEVRSYQDVMDTGTVLRCLSERGYSNFVVWDDQGHLLVCTTDLTVVMSLTRHQLSVWTGDSRTRSVSNHDVLCFTDDDVLLVDKVQLAQRIDLGMADTHEAR